MQPLLDLQDVSLHLPSRSGRGLEPVLLNLSLSLQRGEVLALVGESGCGKTSTARSVLGLLPPGARLSGSIQFATRSGPMDLARLSPHAAAWSRVRGAQIGLVLQQPMHALDPRLRIRTQLLAAARVPATAPRGPALRQALARLEELGLEDAEACSRRYPHQLSGGQLQRVMLALALAQGPDLLIADEPTSALDVLAQAELLSLLRRLRATRPLAILLITHDLGVAAALADRIAVMLAGRLVEVGPAQAIWKRAAHPYTAQLLSDGPGGEGLPWSPGAADFATACAFVPACPRRRPSCSAALPAMEACGEDHACRCLFPIETPRAASAP